MILLVLVAFSAKKVTMVTSYLTRSIILPVVEKPRKREFTHFN